MLIMGPHRCNIACIGNLISSIRSVTPEEIIVSIPKHILFPPCMSYLYWHIRAPVPDLNACLVVVEVLAIQLEELDQKHPQVVFFVDVGGVARVHLGTKYKPIQKFETHLKIL